MRIRQNVLPRPYWWARRLSAHVLGQMYGYWSTPGGHFTPKSAQALSRRGEEKSPVQPTSEEVDP